jgi:hypothetical protein
VQYSGEEAAMRIQYRFARLSKDERELHEMVLLEEIDMQSWFSVSYSCIFGREVFLHLQ